MTRPAPDWTLEQALWRAGYTLVAGLDEAGRGALAGPVVAAVVVFPPQAAKASALQDLNDSKALTPQARAGLLPVVLQHAFAWAVGWASWEEVDRLGVPQATRQAMMRALQALPQPPQFLLLDHLLLPDVPLPQVALPKGDARCATIAAASILAKTVRDAYMQGLDRAYPAYGFARHKGYGTRHHRAALEQHGPAGVHRRRFAPVGRK